MGSVFGQVMSNSSSSVQEIKSENLTSEVSVKVFTNCKHDYPLEVGPQPRSGHRVVISHDDKYLYSYGGYNPSLDPHFHSPNDDWQPLEPVFREFWRYNIYTRQWKKLVCQNMPKALASSSVVLSGKSVLVFGGTGHPFGDECSRILYFCDLARPSLVFEEIKTTGELPDPMYGQALLLDQHMLYTVGGTSGRIFTNDIHRLDLKTKVWERLEVKNPQDCPDPRYRHELALYSNEIYMFGGGVSDIAFSLQKIPVYNLLTHEWRYIDTLPCQNKYPEPRKSHSLVQIPSQPHLIIICGGNYENHAYNDTWMFDIERRQWEHLSNCSLPSHLHFHDSAVTSSGKMFTYGGIKTNDNGTKRTSDVLAAWITIPALSELCFEILLEALPSREAKSLQMLCELGLPITFCRRLVDDESNM